MQTTATNKKVRELLSDIASGNLILKPHFQRRLVWLNSHKINFIKTILEGLPFPEVFIATGELDIETGEGSNILVDGQQRLTTLRDYFQGNDTLKLPANFSPYRALDSDSKKRFLDYSVVVRDLGAVSPEEIKEVFARINATSYPLNAVELDNSQYEGLFKQAAQELADNAFFQRHGIFNNGDVRRMRDLRFCLRFLSTILSTYFNGYRTVETFLEQYDEEFHDMETIKVNAEKVFALIDECNFSHEIRLWQQADLFTLLVELYWAINRDGTILDAGKLNRNLSEFFELLRLGHGEYGDIESNLLAKITAYRESATQATNNRNNQIRRGQIIREIIDRSKQ